MDFLFSGFSLVGGVIKGRRNSNSRMALDLLSEGTSVTDSNISQKVFVSQERVSGFPEKGADLRGSPGTSGEVWGTSGEVRETSGEPLDCCLVPQ